jgi:DNA-binding LytR/AlgR family response regulator
LNILIVEDDLLIAEMLKRMLNKLNYNVCKVCTNFENTIEFVASNQNIDLVFLDINLESKKNGIDIAFELKNTFEIPFVYLTSYSDLKTIKDASKTLPENYLNKPFNETELFTTIEIIKQKINIKPKIIVIKDAGKFININLNYILFAKKEHNYIEIYTNDKRFIIRQSINSLIQEINDKNFVRVHRSFAVQLKRVESIKNQEIKIGKHKIPLSRAFKNEITKKFLSLSN